MTIYDSNQQPSAAPQGYTTVPADAQPTTSADRWALIALAVSLTMVGLCVIPGFGCLAPLIVGIIALTQARNAANPDRARTYGWIATGIGILILLGFIAIVAIYGAFIVSMMNEINREFR